MTSRPLAADVGRNTSRLSRADALRAYFELEELGTEALVGSVRALGWEWVDEKPVREEVREATKVEAPAGEVRIAAPETKRQPIEPIPFWRPIAREYREPTGQSETKRREKKADPPLPGDEQSSVPPPPTPPIVAEPRLRRRLDSALRTPKPGTELDVDAVVHRLSRGETLTELPRRKNSTLARLVLILDPARRLTPFWDDQLQLALTLIHRLGAERIRRLPPPALHDRGGHLPVIAPDEIVLALSDLGFYGTQIHREAWARHARRLRAAGASLLALVPCPAWRWSGPGARLWNAIDWSRPEGPGRRRPPSPLQGAPDSQPAEALLRLLAPAVRVEPGLLRAVRRLLGPMADLGTEAEVWNHPAVDGASSRSLEIQAQQRMELLAESGAGSEAWKALVAEAARTVLGWHEGYADMVWAAETAHFQGCGLSSEVLGEDRVQEAHAVLRRASGALSQAEGMVDKATYARAAFWRREMARLPSGTKDAPEFREVYEQVALWQRQFDPEAPLPAGVSPEMLDPQPEEPLRRLAVWQHGPQFLVGFREVESQGSLLVEMACRRPRVVLADGRGEPVTVEIGEGVVELEAPAFRGEIELTTDEETVVCAPWRLPVWASTVGRDEYGLWAAFEVEGVEQRMRWIPPVRFWMGSPEEEKGRFDDEGPQHLVELTRGYWIAQTPCSQELWAAVMGTNPSRFLSKNRPVEQVSWEDCQRFIDRLSFGVRDMELILPTEAEWEAACRAGTEMATWRGDLEILGDRNAPILDEMAWYGGNSGLEFDLEEGSNSVYWSEKQYEHSKAGTRLLEQKESNSWGLSDVLGNVFEWCWDWEASYPSSEVVDPEGPENGSSRVIRGGSWLSLAGIVRAAYRLGYLPGTRDDCVGFRLSRGPLGRGAAERVSALRSNSGRRRTLAWVAGLGWAVDGGRDEYGRWASLEVGGVRQRLRWIYPGKFLMGSPESEEGRWEDEGPQHEVALTEGFWLGDTPCTQEFWEAVMEANPSRFRSPNRPVEQVSWEDCQEFFERLKERAPEFEGSLPTEAQWEYACRAGTSEATWAGDLRILGARNAPRLDDIAWYGGNSGEGFELAGGYDVSEWEEMQYSAERAGSRGVGLKRANPWGLYDMLGNVLEWCVDAWDSSAGYPGESRVDPISTDGSYRVIRGGSWFSSAGFVRAAYRSGLSPGSRYGRVGFRLSRGPAVRAEPERVERSSTQGREGERRGTRRRSWIAKLFRE